MSLIIKEKSWFWCSYCVDKSLVVLRHFILCRAALFFVHKNSELKTSHVKLIVNFFIEIHRKRNNRKNNLTRLESISKWLGLDSNRKMAWLAQPWLRLDAFLFGISSVRSIRICSVRPKTEIVLHFELRTRYFS